MAIEEFKIIQHSWYYSNKFTIFVHDYLHIKPDFIAVWPIQPNVL